MKKGKTKKLVALASVLALTCACGATQAFVPETYDAPAAYAEEVVKSQVVVDFEALIGTIDAKVVEVIGDITDSKDIAEHVYMAQMQYQQIERAGAEAEVDAAVFAKYEAYKAQFKAMIDAASEADKTFDNFNAAKKNGIVYAGERADYTAAFDFSAFSAEKQAIIDTLGLRNGTRAAKLEEMVDYFNAKDKAEADAQDAVDKIALPIKIASKADIDKAYEVVKKAYGTLEVKAEDSAIIAACVETLDGYTAEYDKLVEDVNTLKGIIEALPENYAAGITTPAYMLGVIAKYDALTDEQEGLINADKVPGTEKTYVVYMNEYYDLSTEADRLAAPVIDAIKAIPALDVFTISDASTVTAAEAAYAALVAHGKGFEAFVYNYATLTAARAELDKLTAGVKAWIAAIDTLLGDRDADEIVLEDATAIAALVETYDAFSGEMQNYIQTEEVVAYGKYDTINATLAAIYAKIEAVSDAYLAIPAVVADYETDIVTYIAEVNAFGSAYTIAKDAYDALTDAEKAYFAENYTDAVAAKAAAEADYAVYGVEFLILAIRDVNETTCAQDLVLADAAQVDPAYAAYLAFEGEVKALFAAKVEDAAAQIKAIRDELDAWMAEVDGVLAADFKAQDITVIEGYLDDYTAFDAEQQAYVDATYQALVAEMDAIVANYTEMNAEIARIKGLATLAASDRDSLDNLEALYNAMHETQQAELVDYDDVVAGTKARIEAAEAFEAIIDTIDATNLTMDNYAFVLSVVALYSGLDAEIQGLVRNADELFDAVDAFVALDEIVDLADVKAAIAEEISAIKGAIDELFKADKAAADKVAELEKMLHNKINDIIEIKIPEAVKAAVEDLTKMMNEKINYVDTAVKALEKALAEAVNNSAEADKALQEASEKLSAALSQLKDEFVKYAALNDEKVAELEKMLHGKVTDIIEIKIPEAVKAAVEELTKMINEKINYVDTKADANADEIIAIKADLVAQIETVNKTIATLESTLQGLIDGLDEKLDAAVIDLQGKLDEAVKALEGKLDEAVKALEGKLDEAVKALEGKLDEAVLALEDALDKAINNSAEADKALKEANDKLSSALSQLKEEYVKYAALNDEKVAELEKMLHSKVTDIIDIKIPEAVKAAVEELTKMINDKINYVDAKANANAAEIIAIKADLAAQIETVNATIATLESTLNATIEGVKSDLEGKLDDAVNTLEGKLDDAVKALEAADAALKAALEAADAALKAALDKEVADREAADKALQEAIASLNTKLVVASVVLAVFTAALIAAVVYIFIKKKD